MNKSKKKKKEEADLGVPMRKFFQNIKTNIDISSIIFNEYIAIA